MHSNKNNILDLVPMVAGLLLFGGLAVTGWLTGAILQALIASAFTVLIGAVLVGMFRQGFRAPTRYERFKAVMTMRPVIIGLVGAGLGVLAIKYVFPMTEGWPDGVKAIFVLVPTALWAGAVFYTLVRSPHRFESDAAYKRRVGYEEP
jgi:hypothetical protein